MRPKDRRRRLKHFWGRAIETGNALSNRPLPLREQPRHARKRGRRGGGGKVMGALSSERGAGCIGRYPAIMGGVCLVLSDLCSEYN